jgi:glycosyltransferase involved in cell wall biosynthesis
MQPLVSVGITAHDDLGIEHTLECIADQTYRNLEIIVSVNPSPDEDTNLRIREIVDRFCDSDTRIRRFYMNRDIGIIENFWFVFQQATGKYFMLAADDDHWERWFIGDLVNAMEPDENISLGITACRRIGPGGKDIMRFPEFRYNYSFFTTFKNMLTALYDDRFGFFYMGLYRKNLLEKVWDRAEDVHGKDIVIVAELLMSTRLCYVDELLFEKQMYGISSTDFDRDPLCTLKFYWYFVRRLTFSRNIPIHRKLVLPLIFGTSFVWMVTAYAMRFGMFIKSL